ncbi:unnamed protein product (macronuclear) [Paramecium tetraurelia]|uniref:Transmembrane protein n=1 Tax=Paramecium tetraurelia TaxID=5888 RepID=A0DF30_PARTE|nr:uncharacterized protein GSPATT00039465001 [Paramecium tetraurelia]CAK81647.1 unnamed protein product [Paramecium tetraurelia]|eukprot:XP_001449044.1 hypothetical protein (macronuclear) [Paramecium tetraurelia strain d4-2]
MEIKQEKRDVQSKKKNSTQNTKSKTEIKGNQPVLKFKQSDRKFRSINAQTNQENQGSFLIDYIFFSIILLELVDLYYCIFQIQKSMKQNSIFQINLSVQYIDSIGKYQILFDQSKITQIFNFASILSIIIIILLFNICVISNNMSYLNHYSFRNFVKQIDENNQNYFNNYYIYIQEIQSSDDRNIYSNYKIPNTKGYSFNPEKWNTQIKKLVCQQYLSEFKVLQITYKYPCILKFNLIQQSKQLFY